ncbi:MAG: hypothetical protein ACRDAX_04115 [Propionibacteriaceae bacterium]
MTDLLVTAAPVGIFATIAIAVPAVLSPLGIVLGFLARPRKQHI